MTAHAEYIDPLFTQLRENRLVLERLVQWKGVEPGMIFSVMDCAVYALALGLLKHDEVEQHLDLLTEPDEPIKVVEDGSVTRIDAVGRHAWLVAEPVLDLAVAAFRQFGGAIVLSNVAEAKQLGVVTAIAEKHHLAARVEPTESGELLIHVSHRNEAEQTVLDRIRRNGIRVGHKRWFELLALSSNALATDTPLSRTHTGSFIVKPDGQVIGRRHDEYIYEDVSMLTAEKLEFRR